MLTEINGVAIQRDPRKEKGCVGGPVKCDIDIRSVALLERLGQSCRWCCRCESEEAGDGNDGGSEAEHNED